MPQILTSNKIALDINPEKFGALRESSDLAGDAGALHRRIAEDGAFQGPWIGAKTQGVSFLQHLCNGFGA